jgi:hypothetical protein
MKYVVVVDETGTVVSAAPEVNQPGPVEPGPERPVDRADHPAPESQPVLGAGQQVLSVSAPDELLRASPDEALRTLQDAVRGHLQRPATRESD